jgi:hypothetical protein
MRRTMLAVALVTLPAQAGSVAHNWKAVPGRSDFLVDIASIRPSGIPNSPNGGPPPPDTQVTVEFKGYLHDFFLVDCEAGVTLDPKDGEYRDNGRLIGFIPDAKIRAMVCPIRHPH